MSSLIIYALLGVVIFAALYFLPFLFDIDVEENQTVVVTEFGKVTHVFDRPGHVFFMKRLLPWVQVNKVSTQLVCEDLNGVFVADQFGTSMQVDIWVEYRTLNARKLLFAIENWRSSFKSLVTSVSSKRINQLKFSDLLGSTENLEGQLLSDINQEVSSWGLEVEQVKIKNFRLSSEVQQQILQSISAHLEKKKSIILETAKLKSDLISAEVEKEVSTDRAAASVQMAQSVSKAYADLKTMNPMVFKTYEELYRLSVINPDQVMVFEGFGDKMTPEIASYLIGHENKKDNQNSKIQ